MSDAIQPPPLPRRIPSSGSFAFVSLSLGITSILTGLIMVGGLAGLVGLVLGILHLRKYSSHRAAAGWGIGLSLIGVALAIAALTFFLSFIRPILQGTLSPEKQFNRSEWIGKPLPALSLTALDGRVIRLADLKGHPTILAMWASWHPACTGAVADFNRLLKDASARGVQVVAVSFEDAADVTAFMAGKSFDFPVVVTNDLPAPFGSIASIPTTFTISTNGIICDVQVGYDGYPSLIQSITGHTPATRQKDSEGHQ